MGRDSLTIRSAEKLRHRACVHIGLAFVLLIVPIATALG
jgi:hypothetical protein